MALTSTPTLKGLHLLRTDAASVSMFGGAIPAEQREAYVSKFMAECHFMRRCTHPNIVPFYGVVVDATPRAEPLYLAMQYIHSGWPLGAKVIFHAPSIFH